jgi:Holliday junction resolvase
VISEKLKVKENEKLKIKSEKYLSLITFSSSFKNILHFSFFVFRLRIFFVIRFSFFVKNIGTSAN